METLARKHSSFSMIDNSNDFNFLVSLTEKDLLKIEHQEYLDFQAIFRRGANHPQTPRILVSYPDNDREIKVLAPVMRDAKSDEQSFEEWSLVFLPFSAEQARLLPEYSLGMPKYMEFILRMAHAGKEWHRYDETFRSN